MSKNIPTAIGQARESTRLNFLRENNSYGIDRALVPLGGRETEAVERPVNYNGRHPSPPPPRRRITREDSPMVSAGSSLLKGTQALIGPSVNRDTTIHLQLDIEEDIESHLEEFSRLKRLGNYKNAEEYFQDHLQEFIDIPPVSVEFADMLLTQGAYKRLKELRQQSKLKPPPSPDDVAARMSKSKKRPNAVPKLTDNSDCDSDSSSEMLPSNEQNDRIKQTSEDADRFDVTFHLIEDSSYMFSQGWLTRALKSVMNIEHDLAPNSTSVRNDILSIPQKYTNRVYWHLLEQGRIWEVRDLILACIHAFGAQDTWRAVLGADLNSPDFITKFLGEWRADKYDPSTYLAILDILVALSQYLILVPDLSSEKEIITTIKRCLEQARDLVASIKENDSEYIKSRPYIRWILVQEQLSRKLGYEEEGGKSHKSALNFQHLRMFPGITLWKNSLPAYAPAQAENPGFHVSHFLESDNELLHIALQASEELEDYRTQVLCLRELICRAKDPEQLFGKLTKLQKSVQGDITGYLQTCISKYLYATTDESREALIDELSNFDGQQVMSYRIDNPLILWQERKVQSALYLSMGLTDEATSAQGIASKYERDLPYDVQRSISRLGLSVSRNIETEGKIKNRESDDNGVLRRAYEQKRKHQHREISNPSYFNTSDSKPLKREENIYSPRIITIEREPDHVKASEASMQAPMGNFNREREHPTIKNELAVIPNRERFSAMSTNDIQYRGPPPSTRFAQPRAIGWTLVQSDNEEVAKRNDRETIPQGNLVEKSFLERKDEGIVEEYKQHRVSQERERSPSSEENVFSGDSMSDSYISGGEDTERNGDTHGGKIPQISNSAVLGSENGQKVQTANGKTRSNATSRSLVNKKSEKLTEDGKAHSVRKFERSTFRGNKSVKTELPQRDKQATLDAEYPFSEEALSSEGIDQAIKPNEDYKASEISEKNREDKDFITKDHSDEIAPLSPPQPKVVSEKGFGLESLKRTQTFPTSEEVSDDGMP